MQAPKSNEIFKFYPAHTPFIGILSIPHSGEEIPDEFRPYLYDDFARLSRDVDTGVHELVDIEKLNKNGISVIKANIHRICIDLNRPMQNSMLNWKKNSHGEITVTQEPDDETREKFQLKYHAPYYEMLKALINELIGLYPKASFVDLHSMPSLATDYHLKINPKQDKHRPDFCLSDVNGESCEASFIQTFKSHFDKKYSNVKINDPYFGGNVTREINNLFPNINNIQIEISRGLYLDETNRSMLEEKATNLKENLTEILIQSFKEVLK